MSRIVCSSVALSLWMISVPPAVADHVQEGPIAAAAVRAAEAPVQEPPVPRSTERSVLAEAIARAAEEHGPSLVPVRRPSLHEDRRRAREERARRGAAAGFLLGAVVCGGYLILTSQDGEAGFGASIVGVVAGTVGAVIGLTATR